MRFLSCAEKKSGGNSDVNANTYRRKNQENLTKRQSRRQYIHRNRRTPATLKPRKETTNMKNITFSLKKVPNALTDKHLYRANVQANGVVGHEELAKLVADRTKQDASLWKYFLDVLADEIDNQMLEGNRIKLGRLFTGFAIRGTFTNEDDQFDPEKHKLVATVRMLDPLRNAMDAVVPENVAVGISCIVSSVMDAVTRRTSEIVGTNRVLIQGKRLGISPDNPDEGVWLADPKTDRIVATATVERSDSQTIDCVFAEPPAPGMYTLVVGCRNGARETLAPAIARVKKVILHAQA